MPNEPKLDRLDIKILAELQKNGRATNVSLADKIGLSPSPCLKRIKRLEESGYISGYAARIDTQKLGDVVTVFTEITLVEHYQHSFQDFERILRQYPEAVECHLISGGYDYLCKFVTKSISAYQELMEDLLENKKAIKEYYSYVVLRSPITGRDIPLEKIFI